MKTRDAEPTPILFSVHPFCQSRTMRRSAVVLMIIVVCAARGSGAIRASASLGVTVQYELPFTPQLPALLHYSSTHTADLVCIDPSSSQLVILRNNGFGIFSNPVAVAKVSDATSLAIGDVNADGIDDIVVVRREQRQIELLLSSVADSTYAVVRYPVRYYPDHAVIADLDADRLPDIISYGKVSSGITVLRGLGKGAFAEAKELFSDIPVSDVSVRQLNGDGFPDVILYNWLSAELVFMIGMGNQQFSEQTVVPLQKDSAAVAFLNSNGDAATDFAIALPDKNIMQFYEGDGLGAYHLMQTLDLNLRATRLESMHLRSRNFDDVLATNSDNGMFSLYLNRGDGTFDEEIQFGGSEGVLLHGDVDGDGNDDLVAIPVRGRTAQLYYNGERTTANSNESATASTVSYPVGKNPIALVVGDFNNDGREDIATANMGSSSMSLLLSTDSAHAFTGQRSFETVQSPTSLRLYAKSDTSVTFIFAHATRSRVSVLSLNEHPKAASEGGIETQLYTIPTAERPSLIISDLAVQKKTIEFYVASGAPQASLSYYQQVRGTKFIERSFRPIIPAKILAGAVTDFNCDGRPDLAYVYNDQTTGRNALGITFADSSGQYRSNTLSYIFPDSVIKRCFVYFDDFDGDNYTDCLLAQSPANTLGIARGFGAGKFRDMITIASSVPVSGSDQIQVLDFDGDGVLDIVVMNASTSELFFLRGKGNAGFYSKQFILDVPVDGAFRCADINGDGVMDVVVTDPRRNIVTIHYANSQ
ncbi:MAG TPA: VCBS repeat-containing protein [Bacteroidota bacterium]|nr:VCBS repeat-containing protein [Bacteroidota bacterium]